MGVGVGVGVALKLVEGLVDHEYGGCGSGGGSGGGRVGGGGGGDGGMWLLDCTASFCETAEAPPSRQLLARQVCIVAFFAFWHESRSVQTCRITDLLD
jgi:hypothetical protein